MKVHLVTVIGADVTILPHMLRHYRGIGIDSFLINVHLKSEDDQIIHDVRKFTDEAGCGISSVSVGKWSEELNWQLYSASRKNADDWYIIADLDEFQKYPKDLLTIIEECEIKGYDYIEGCFIDRIAGDGSFPEVLYDRSIEDQFPLGCTFTYSVLGGYPIKVVAVKGYTNVAKGNHFAMTGNACPIEECFVEVHHYKWDKRVVNRMMHRANSDKRLVSDKYKQECQKFIDYFQANHGQIDISDPRLHVASCKPHYKYWGVIKETVLSIPIRPGHGTK
jgi:hypothetical protein